MEEKELILSRQEMRGINDFIIHGLGLAQGHCCLARV